MELEGIIPSELSQRKDKQHMISCGIRKQKTKLKDTENRLVLERGGVSDRPRVSETGSKFGNFQLENK